MFTISGTVVVSSLHNRVFNSINFLETVHAAVEAARTFTQMGREAIGRVQRAVQVLLEAGCTAEEVLQQVLQ